ncbi:redoxin domain-containing protein [Algoriphagus aestuariicola]|uniref:Redoxin domain-containing protein n=1 Tax=Algoriphagus aestuariicola TaxID=1852016 RepID=A0ABS3BTJ0_9BACT|nr:redoxin domain-containing protein [Algoriphagus aestuariicola]MBN7802618.1 redoxin domain-containing protein [Algoriphagus aestuariicola]
MSYHQTAYYPIPDADIVDSSKMFVVIFNPGLLDYQFLVSRMDVDEVYQDGIFSEVRHKEKAYYRYEKSENQKSYMESSLLNKYGPISLLQHEWKYLNDTALSNRQYGHFMRIEREWVYEEKQIVVEHHIFLSPDDLIARFERRNYVDGALTQTVTYRYDEYQFDQHTLSPRASSPELYSMKYFERVDKLKALEKGTSAPHFEGRGTNGEEIVFGKELSEQTLLLFGSISCGYSQMVIEHISQEQFKLKNGVALLTFLGSDTRERAVKYLEKFPLSNPVIVDRRDIETSYGIAGYPILHLIDQNGTITESLAGSSGIIELLDRLAAEK